MKLYNAGSFFDPRAVPEDDYGGIAGQLAGLDRVIVESHPALVGPRVDKLLDALARHAAASGAPPRLEVAMGLETVHPDALDKLNKRMTVDDFVRAAGLLRRRDVALRVFLLISPPGVPDANRTRGSASPSTRQLTAARPPYRWCRRAAATARWRRCPPPAHFASRDSPTSNEAWTLRSPDPSETEHRPSTTEPPSPESIS